MAEQDDIRRQERIEAYVGGKLAGEELRAFEAELAADAQLQRDVEVERTLAGTLRRSPELRFRDLVQRVSDDQERGATGGGGAEKPVIPIDRGRMKWWAVAAGVALLIGAGAVLFLQGSDPQQLAMTEVREFTITVRGDSTGTSAHADALMKARQLILDHKPAEAIASLQVPRTAKCEEAERRWLLGLAYLLADQEAKARPELNRVSSAGCAVSRKATALLKEL